MYTPSPIGKKSRLKRIIRGGRTIIFAYDHGLERGPMDMPPHSRGAARLLDEIISEGVDAVLLTPGLAAATADIWVGRTSLVLKITGRTRLRPQNERLMQTLIASVEEAIRLDAAAVAATVYWGSPYEDQMLRQWTAIREKAHSYGIPAIQLAYPRGPAVISRYEADVVAYSVRAAAETGADIVATYFSEEKDRYGEIIEAASGTPVLMSGGVLRDKPEDFLGDVEAAVNAGAAGVLVGRNIFMRENPAEMLRMVKEKLGRS